MEPDILDSSRDYGIPNLPETAAATLPSLADGLGGFNGVGTRQLKHGQRDRRQAIEVGVHAVIAAPSSTGPRPAVG